MTTPLTQNKKTGVGSLLRKKYIKIMKKNLELGMTKNECVIEPVTGEVTSQHANEFVDMASQRLAKNTQEIDITI